MQLFLGQMEPLFGLSSLRTSLEALLKPVFEETAKLDASTAEAYAMGIYGLSSTFTKLESEVCPAFPLAWHSRADIQQSGP